MPKYLDNIEIDIKNWTFSKVEDKPFLFGSDIGNPAIIKQYLVEFNPNTKVEDLTLETISSSVAVSRMKNKVLEDNPQFDFREVYKPKKKLVEKD